MRLVVVEGIDPSDIARRVDPGTFRNGAALAQQRAVLRLEWIDAAQMVLADVRGSRRRHHSVIVRFLSTATAGLRFVAGACDCSMSHNCAHAVAAALTVAGYPGAAADPATAWERALDSLLGADTEPDLLGRGVPLAMELSLPLDGPAQATRVLGRPALVARIVRPGRNGWVGGGMTWGKLEQRYQFADCRAEHVRWLRELYALARSHRERSAYHYHDEDKTIDLADFESQRLWSMLDEAPAIGLQLVHPRKRLGALPGYGHGELTIDVTAGEAEGALSVAPVLRIEGVGKALPVGFIGSTGHGVVYLTEPPVRGTPRPEWPIRLARLAEPVPPPLQRMALGRERLAVPAAARDAFAEKYVPRLRKLATLASSDGAFNPPAVSAPALLLHAAYHPEHLLELRWEWSYTVGDKQLRTPLAGSEVGDHRDLAAERGLLAGLDLPLEQYGLCGDKPGAELVSRRLAGLDTMRFTTELLPLLSGDPRVVVEVTGEPPAYRDAGDSLLIGVTTDDVPGEPDWFDLGVRITLDGREVPFAEVFVALAAGETHLMLDDGAYFSLQKPALQALRDLIEEARALQDAPTGPLRLSRFQAGLWAELAALGVVERQAAAWRTQVTGLLSLDTLTTAEPPVELTVPLRPYQRDGFGWLAFLWQHRLGGILADDMGLGKTLQSLALACHAKRAEPTLDPFLVVAPTSVVSNWAAEAARFIPGLRVVVITDTLRRRGAALAEVIAGADLVVTTYTLLRLDIDAYAATGWSGLIMDEAQFAKNHQSKIYQCLRRLPAPFKLAITGTPMENNLMELWSLLSITAPGLFPNPTRFQEQYARPIERQSDAEALGRLRRRIRPLVKRRTKEQVAADLPAKQEQVLDIELDARHRRIYQRQLQRERQKVLGLLDDVERNRFTILRSLTLLRQLSLHPGLVDPTHLELGSSKIDALLEQLTEVVAGGHRALVFSQFTGFLGQVRDRLDAAGIAHCYLDGGTRNRGAVVQRFTDGAAPVFLISLKAGGFGLNLTEADYCFLLDPWWNPAAEAQAVDRTHRIGQTRTVMVYRLIAKDTIEEKVLALASRKAALFSGVMNDGNVFGSTLDADDIRELLA